MVAAKQANYCVGDLDAYLAANQPNWTLKIFKNDVMPNGDTVVGDLIEADFAGYADQPCPALDPAAWESGNQRAHAETATTADWTISAGTQNVYGIYAVDGGGDLVWAQRFIGAPVALTFGGAIDELKIMPTANLESE